MNEGWGWLWHLMAGGPRPEGEPTPDTERHENALKEKRPHRRKSEPLPPKHCHRCRKELGDTHAMANSQLYCLGCVGRVME